MMPKKPWRSFTHWRQQDEKYEALDSEQQQAFLSDDETPFVTEKNVKRKLSNPRFWTMINILIMCISVFTNCLRFLPERNSSAPEKCTSSSSTGDLSDAIRATSAYSPILKDMDIELRDVKLNGTLWPPREPSVFRWEPSEEVDDFWEDYEPLDVFPITGADVVALGGDPAQAVRFQDDIFGLGEDAYMAGFDMLHKTHCLNELRKMTFEDYYQPKGFYKTKHHGKFWWVHLRHCVDMLMQDQMCHADADIILFNWVDTQSYPWPELSLTRKCRSWDQMLDWGKDRYVDLEKLKGMTKPKDAVQIPFERGYYEWYGFEDSDLYPNGTGYPW